MTVFFKLIRYKNLLMIALLQVLIKYALLEPFGVTTFLSDVEFILLVLASVSIAAAGNVINDVYDVSIDRINKPEKLLIGKKITEKTAYNFYIFLNILGVGIGFYLANVIGHPSFSAIFIVFSALLYLYSSYLKSVIIAGNAIVSFLVAMTVIIVGLFELYPAITPENRAVQSTMFAILLDYAIFAFFINFLREIVKDLEDINGDKKGGMQTLPILLGRARAGKVASLMGLLAAAAVFYYLYMYMYQQELMLLYFLLFIIGPLIYFVIKIYQADNKSEYRRLSLLLKGVMIAGTLSLLLYPLILN